jgi:hypothetical protein
MEDATDETPNISGSTLFDPTSVDAFGVSYQRGAVLLCSLQTVHRELSYRQDGCKSREICRLGVRGNTRRKWPQASTVPGMGAAPPSPLGLTMSHILLGWTPSLPGGNPNSECRNPTRPSKREARRWKQIPIPNVPPPKHRRPRGSGVVSNGSDPFGIGIWGLFPPSRVALRGTGRVWDLGFGIPRASKRTKSTTDRRCPAAQLMGKDKLGEREGVRGNPEVSGSPGRRRAEAALWRAA